MSHSGTRTKALTLWLTLQVACIDGKQFVTMGGGVGGVGTSTWFQDVSGFTIGTSYDLHFMIAAETTSDIAQIVSAMVSSPGGAVKAATFLAPPSSANYWRT